MELQTAFQGSEQASGARKPPSFSILRSTLQSLSRFQRITLLIDAIDECESRQDLLEFISDLEHSTRRISVLVTSRDEVDIKDALTSFKRVQIEHHVKKVDEDIKSYIEHRLSFDARLRKLQPSLKENIQ